MKDYKCVLLDYKENVFILPFIRFVWLIVLPLCHLELAPHNCEYVLQQLKWNSSWIKDDNGAFIVRITFILVSIFLLKGSDDDAFFKNLLYMRVTIRDPAKKDEQLH